MFDAVRPLLDAHPALSLEVIMATSHDLITARDFDVAVTLERPSPRSAPRVRRLICCTTASSRRAP